MVKHAHGGFQDPFFDREHPFEDMRVHWLPHERMQRSKTQRMLDQFTQDPAGFLLNAFVPNMIRLIQGLVVLGVFSLFGFVFYALFLS